MGYNPPPFQPRKPDKPPPGYSPGSPFFVKCDYCGRYPEPDRSACPGCGAALELFVSKKREAGEIRMNVKVNPDLDPKEFGRLWGKKIFELTPEILEDPGFLSLGDLPDPPEPSTVIR